MSGGDAAAGSSRRGARPQQAAHAVAARAAPAAPVAQRASRQTAWPAAPATHTSPSATAAFRTGRSSFRSCSSGQCCIRFGRCGAAVGGQTRTRQRSGGRGERLGGPGEVAGISLIGCGHTLAPKGRPQGRAGEERAVANRAARQTGWAARTRCRRCHHRASGPAQARPRGPPWPPAAGRGCGGRT